MKLTKGQISVIVILLVLLIDQITKFWVKTHMYLGQDIRVTDWFYILFVENNGMAFGIEIISKLFLSVFRILAVGFISYYLFKLVKKEVKTGYVICVALILAGAAGNIIDSIFYGVIFDNPPAPFIATFLPEGGGYGTLFHGKVVDMLYFPLFRFYWPDWIPFVGGDSFEFFRPVFNIADSAISIGVILVLLFYRKYLSSEDHNKKHITE
ncbi:lipoprotein signal peptidase [Coprobacter tertius]|uniref:Lipoprotein signal peptidase n=1 Tax=Coprobacter tertius TaxID=2944915 RepID=A0ABT1MIF6_9BACT|nr:lipoprotein signal peptidase [Coprobacter tertius]MCP9612211.1 lipoprotein signal peptidase [Coprobacter tertius]